MVRDPSAGESPCGSWAGFPVGGVGTRAPGGAGGPLGALSAGSSPHPSLTEEEDSQTELLIAGEKLSPEQEGQLMPQVGVPHAPPAWPQESTPACLPASLRPPSGLGTRSWRRAEEYVLDMLRDQLNRRQPTTASRGTSCGCSPPPAAGLSG